MKYPNAYDGVKKIYTAEILMVVAAVLSLIAGAIGVTNANGIVGAAIIILIAAVISMVAAIMNIVGVNRASKDEDAFKKALIALLVGIVANLLITSFSENAVVSGIGNFIGNVTEFLASYFICTGIINLADKIGDPVVSDKGKRVRTILMILFLISAVLSLLSALFSGNTGLMTAAAVVALISGAVSVVAYLMYLSLLSKAKKMLAEA